ncbi:hypothetical protein DNTS_022994 [Danionella cerebrum]|uniref:Uncharacterized protein n=1 Tax=Danionella cerebrum TaxID=2873325 RepID=A0A553RB81_9TELE|nr:hypothetical protein DNTS_022994 [Danionella translucida]
MVDVSSEVERRLSIAPWRSAEAAEHNHRWAGLSSPAMTCSVSESLTSPRVQLLSGGDSSTVSSSSSTFEPKEPLLRGLSVDLGVRSCGGSLGSSARCSLVLDGFFALGLISDLRLSQKCSWRNQEDALLRT